MKDRLDIADLRREMIGEFLEERKLRYLKDRDGDFVVRFRWEPRTVEFLIGADDTGSLLWFQSRASTTFPVEDVPLLLLATNAYVSRFRWPRLRVVVEGTEALVLTDGHLLMAESLEQDELDRFLECALMSTRDFWANFELPDVASLDAEIISFLQDNQNGAA
jgi:hypothetical protein